MILRNLLLIVLLFIVAEEVDAQRRAPRTTRRESPRRSSDEYADQGTWLGISLGNLGFNRGFMASAKVSYGYDLNNFLSFGVNGKFFYDNFNNIGAPDINLFSYGGAAFLRLSVTQDIFLQGEYGRTSLERNGNIRNTYTYPAVGGGYKSGFGNWTYGLHILFPIHEEVRDYLNVEYWIDFNYKF